MNEQIQNSGHLSMTALIQTDAVSHISPYMRHYFQIRPLYLPLSFVMLDHTYIHPICSKSNHSHSDIHAILHSCRFQESQDTRHSPLPAKFRRYHYHYRISHTILQGKTCRLLMYTTLSISSFQQIYLSFPVVIMVQHIIRLSQ